MNEDREHVGDAPTERDQERPAPESTTSGAADPADQVPVPGAMSPAEIDERAQVVEALRREKSGRTGDPPPEP
jgi:hypothetical protein